MSKPSTNAAQNAFAAVAIHFFCLFLICFGLHLICVFVFNNIIFGFAQNVYDFVHVLHSDHAGLRIDFFRKKFGNTRFYIGNNFVFAFLLYRIPNGIQIRIQTVVGVFIYVINKSCDVDGYGFIHDGCFL